MNVDRLIHEPARLKIMTVLSGVNAADFASLRETLQLTGGNLSTHVSRLEAAGYLQINKRFVGKAPHTDYRLTRKGRRALARYWTCIDQIRDLAVVWQQASH